MLNLVLWGAGLIVVAGLSTAISKLAKIVPLDPSLLCGTYRRKAECRCGYSSSYFGYAGPR